jgi:uncharacterized protein YecE (DUF72 family)
MSDLAGVEPIDREQLAAGLAELAQHGIYLGTSSWKYPGWRGLFYDEQRYVYRGKFAESRFEKNCLSEFAQVFKTVCVDAGYYRFPDARYLEGLMSQVPADFKFTFKVTDEITVKNFSNLPRFGVRAGQPNPHFLNADLFTAAFLKPFEPFRDQVGTFIFEFSKFNTEDFSHGREFAAQLDRFLAALPKGWNYAVEIRNRTFLQPEYFAVLARHGVAHVYNSWSAMPPVIEQLAIPETATADFTAARFLLKPGRKFAEAVEFFSPYNRLKEPYDEGRLAILALANFRASLKRKYKNRFIYINNRFEGCSLLTIIAILLILKNSFADKPAGVAPH